jgi:hypothetical protein
MASEPKQATSATMAIVYITVGALMAVWTTVYYFYLQQHGPTGNEYFWCGGLFFSGLVLIGIGLMVGQIGRSARAAEVAAMPTQVIAPNGTVAETTVPANAVASSPQTAMHAVPADNVIRRTT